MNRVGLLTAEYMHGSGSRIRIYTKQVYTQPWAVPEYFIEYTNNCVEFLAPSRRIYSFNKAYAIALEKMKSSPKEYQNSRMQYV